MSVKVYQDLLVRLVHLVNLAHLVNREQKENLENPVQVAQQVCKDLQEVLVHKEQPAQLDQLVLMEPQIHLALVKVRLKLMRHVIHQLLLL
jgi:hypothetical protein